MNQSNPNPTEREQDEIQILSLLLGELSPGEVEDIRKKLESDSSLAAYADDLQGTLGLVREATGPAIDSEGIHTPITEFDLQLDSKQREALLRAFQTAPSRKRQKTKFAGNIIKNLNWFVPLSAAACLMLSFLLNTFDINITPTSYTVHSRAGSEYSDDLSISLDQSAAPHVEAVATMEFEDLSETSNIVAMDSPKSERQNFDSKAKEKEWLSRGRQSDLSRKEVTTEAANQSIPDERRSTGNQKEHWYSGLNKDFTDLTSGSRDLGISRHLSENAPMPPSRPEPTSSPNQTSAFDAYGESNGSFTTDFQSQLQVINGMASPDNALIDVQTKQLGQLGDEDALDRSSAQDSAKYGYENQGLKKNSSEFQLNIRGKFDSPISRDESPTDTNERSFFDHKPSQGIFNERRFDEFSDASGIANRSKPRSGIERARGGSASGGVRGITKRDESVIQNLFDAPGQPAEDPFTDSSDAFGRFSKSDGEIPEQIVKERQYYLPVTGLENKGLKELETLKVHPDLSVIPPIKLAELPVLAGAIIVPATPKATPRPEVSTKANAFSTFSLNVSDVSFKLAKAALESSNVPEPSSVRSEEFINAMNYHDPAPKQGERVGFSWDHARNPFTHNRDLIRFSVQTAAAGRETGQPLNLVLVLDNSGSMERPDRVDMVRNGLGVLANKLNANDRISVVSFARNARLWVDGMKGGQPRALLERLGHLTPEGGTNLEAALRLAYETAQKHFNPKANNRVILLTDGAANLGEVNPEALKSIVIRNRHKQIATDSFGIGWDGYNDELLEAITRNGDGRYGFLNDPAVAPQEFSDLLAGALTVAASNVKAQVEFNPDRVSNWRQIGYESHQLTKQQFRDNTIDAAEIAAKEAGTALYSVEIDRNGKGPIGTVRLRYKIPATGKYVEESWPLPYSSDVKELENAPAPMRVAASAAAFAELLAGSPHASNVQLSNLQRYLTGISESWSNDKRIQELNHLVSQARLVLGQ
ncbi:von Willebrand factor type A domain-containing protein [bacterium]|nr:von Willebrand factor type A domain-containing protein [bacterium]